MLAEPLALIGVEGGGAVLSLTRTEQAGNTKGGSITVSLTSCLTGLDKSVLQNCQ